jgi:curved DNA-binding protein CbpA
MDAEDNFESEIGVLHDGLAKLTYYDFLGLRPGCDYVAIREAFYGRAQLFHPDRFVAVPSEATKRQAYAVYKRMSEAYSVLVDPHLRTAYDEARLRGELRLSEVARARRLTADERQLANRLARIYLRSAQAKIERGELKAAWIDVQLGRSLEDAPPLRELQRRIEEHPAAPAFIRGRGES